MTFSYSHFLSLLLLLVYFFVHLSCASCKSSLVYPCVNVSSSREAPLSGGGCYAVSLAPSYYDEWEALWDAALSAGSSSFAVLDAHDYEMSHNAYYSGWTPQQTADYYDVNRAAAQLSAINHRIPYKYINEEYWNFTSNSSISLSSRSPYDTQIHTVFVLSSSFASSSYVLATLPAYLLAANITPRNIIILAQGCEQHMLYANANNIDYALFQQQHMSISCSSLLAHTLTNNLTDFQTAVSPNLTSQLFNSNQQIEIFNTPLQLTYQNIAYEVGPLMSYYFSPCSNALRSIYLFELHSNTSFTYAQKGVSNRGDCGAPLNELDDDVKTIVLGQSGAFTGAAGSLGTDFLAGLRRAFATPLTVCKNCRRPRIVVLPYDDFYDPPHAVQNVAQLLNRDNVFSLIGSVGTPTTVAVLPQVLNHSVPLFCSFTGTRTLRHPVNPLYVNLRTGYDDETTAQVEYLMQNNMQRISIFYQDDSFGTAGLNGLKLALTSKAINLFSSGIYTRNTLKYEPGLNSIIQANPDLPPQAIVCIGTAQAIALFIKAAKYAWSQDAIEGRCNRTSLTAANSCYNNSSPNPFIQFLTVSFVNSHALSLALDVDFQNVIVSQVTPPFSQQWTDNEGYLCGLFFRECVKRTQDNGLALTRANLITTIQTTGAFQFTPPGLSKVIVGPFSPQCGQGLHEVYLTRLLANYSTQVIDTFTVPECGVDITGLSQPRPFIFGQSAAFSGSALFLGTEMRRGIEAAFTQQNQAKGIYGHYLKLISLDDGYTPELALANAVSLVNQSCVLAILGSVGTPTTNAMVPFLRANSIPLIGSFTGSRGLRHPFVANFVNVRASYDDEVYAMVEMCIKLGLERISIFQQRDSYGDTGFNALSLQLQRRNLNVLSRGFYERNTEDIAAGLLNMTTTQVPQAILCMTTSPAAAKFILEAQAIPAWGAANIVYFTVSFVAAELTAKIISANHSSVNNTIPTPILYSMQVVPHPSDNSSAFAQEFTAALAYSCPSCVPSFVSLEGYAAAKLIINSLLSNPQIITQLQSVSDPTNTTQFRSVRDSMLSNLYYQGMHSVSSTLRLGPFTSQSQCSAVPEASRENSCLCNQGSHSVYMTQFQPHRDANGHIIPSGPQLSNMFVRKQENDFIFSDCGTDILQAVPAAQRPIVFGQVAVFSGIAADLGREMRRGIRAAFKQFNTASGGVHGRQLILLSYDDGYEPTQTTVAVKQLISQNIFAAIGSIGTPTTVAALPILANASVPLIGAFTGSNALRIPFQRLVINIRASYDDELAGIMDYVVANGLSTVSILYQDDSFGNAGLSALKLSLSYHRMKLSTWGTYPRNTLNIELGYFNITRNSTFAPDMIVLIGTAAPLAKFVKLVRTSGFNSTKFSTVSFVGAEQFASLLGNDVTNVLVSQVVPNPYDADSQLIQSYKSALHALESNASSVTFGSLEGYIAARLCIAALLRASDVTPAAFLQAIYQGTSFDIDGTSVGPFQDGSTTLTQLNSISNRNLAASPSVCNRALSNIMLTSIRSFTSSFTFTTDRVFTIPYDVDPLTGNCGVRATFSDAACPVNTVKIYTSPLTTKHTCEACVYPTFGDGSTTPCQRTYYQLSNGIVIAFRTIAGISIIITLISAGVITAHRKRMIVKSASYPFSMSILFGILLLYILIFLITEYAPTTSICVAQIWIGHLGFMIIFASLYIKSYRVQKIFNMQTLKTLKMSDKRMMKVELVIFLLLCIYLIVWTTHGNHSQSLVIENGQYVYTCSSNSSVYVILLLAIEFVSLFSGAVVAYKCRNNPSYYNESKYIALCIYNTFLLSIIGVSIVYALLSTIESQIVIISLFVWLGASVVFALLFGPKLYPILMKTYDSEVEINKLQQFIAGGGVGAGVQGNAAVSGSLSGGDTVSGSNIPASHHSANAVKYAVGNNEAEQSTNSPPQSTVHDRSVLANIHESPSFSGMRAPSSGKPAIKRAPLSISVRSPKPLDNTQPSSQLRNKHVQSIATSMAPLALHRSNSTGNTSLNGHMPSPLKRETSEPNMAHSPPPIRVVFHESTTPVLKDSPCPSPVPSSPSPGSEPDTDGVSNSTEGQVQMTQLTLHESEAVIASTTVQPPSVRHRPPVIITALNHIHQAQLQEEGTLDLNTPIADN